MSGFAIVPRVLGVDFGQARIGVAVSDELGMLAHPVETVPGRDVSAAAKRIAEIARNNNVERIIVGLPRHMNGAIGLAAEDAQAFAAKLQALVSCPVELCDERLSTTAANRALRNSGMRTRQTRGIVDQVAAQMILQSYLDSRQTFGASNAEIPTPE